MKNVFLVVMLFLIMPVSAQEKNTDHTYKLADKSIRPQARIEEVSWLVGSWTGTAFGKQFEEVWNPPSVGTMVGFFKLYDEEKGVDFYELLLIKEVEGSLSLLVKHFDAEFNSWEEKSDYVDFKLVAIKENEIHFSGLSFYRKNEKEITGYIALRMKDGSVTEKELLYKRN